MVMLANRLPRRIPTAKELSKVTFWYPVPFLV